MIKILERARIQGTHMNIIPGRHRTSRSGQPMVGLTSDPHHRDPMPNTAWMARNQRLDSPETYDKKNINKMIPSNIFTYS